ncbi:MAG: SDR family oxidoreductase [Acidobacteria bacterium]|nr:SDR family oxidoreductase [Acidobacteriota bacterium]
MKLQDRIALVTGGGSGIGRAIALLFAEEAAHVIVNDLTAEAAEKTIAAMGAAKARGLAVAADVSDSARVRAMFATVESQFGRLDVLVNNAGIPTPKEKGDELNRKHEARLAEMAAGKGIQTHWDVTVETTDEEWSRMLAVHLNGTFFCSREALKLMSRRNSGAIINISSIVALGGMATGSAYAAAKGGVLSFTRALALEVASRNIRVNAICPGWVDTPLIQPLPPPVRTMVSNQIPLGRLAEPREIATTALFLASDDSSYITGQWISPNGGIYIG